MHAESAAKKESVNPLTTVAEPEAKPIKARPAKKSQKPAKRGPGPTATASALQPPDATHSAAMPCTAGARPCKAA